MATDLHNLVANKLNKRHIRKGRKVAIVIADMATAIPTALTEAASASAAPTLKELTGFRAFGLLSKSDGVTKSRDREVQTTMAIGFQDSVRSDVSSDTTKLKCVGLEMNRLTIEQYLQVDLSAAPLDPVTKELQFPHPTDGNLPQNRVMAIAQDGSGADLMWWATLLTAAVVDETDDQTLGNDEDPLGWPVTFSSEVDTDLGYSVRSYFGGPGWKSRLASMGFPTS